MLIVVSIKSRNLTRIFLFVETNTVVDHFFEIQKPPEAFDCSISSRLPSKPPEHSLEPTLHLLFFGLVFEIHTHSVDLSILIMAVTESPWKAAGDSPSRQLLWELSRLAVTAQEDLYERLDRDSQEREAAHKSALAKAIAKHEKVRKDAEAERDRLEKQMQQERERRAAEARQEEERQRRVALEREKVEKRRAAEQAEAAARAERAATEERNAELARQKAEKDRQTAEAVKAKKIQQQEEAKKKADDERRVKEEAAAGAGAGAAQEARLNTSTAKQSRLITQGQIRNPQREAEHQRYLEIHKNLKELRKSMVQQAKQDSKLKSRMGDMRRDIKKSVGQIIEGKGKNTKPVSLSDCSII